MLHRFSREVTFFQKIKNIDYILLASLLILSILSVLTMYSTDGGEVLFHTKSHFLKLIIFFPMMIGSLSPLITTVNQTLAFSCNSTSPMTAAFGAIKFDPLYFGACSPS